MADTTLLKTQVESFICEELGKWYPSRTFTEISLPLGTKKDGTKAVHRFDAVSDNKAIVASIKSHSWRTSGGKYPAGKVASLYQAVYFLSQVEAKEKLLILTDEKTYEGFLSESDGKIEDNIKIKLISLSPELQMSVDKVQQKASREMS